jgi:cytochrome b561
MAWVNTDTRYGALAQALHWATVICVVAAWLLGEFIDDFPKGIVRQSAFATHAALGEFVLAALAARLLWRFVNAPPAPLPTRFGRMEEIAAMLGHYALYALLLVVPIVGMVAVASPWPADRAAAHSVMEVHELLANALLVFAALHASAALIHHYVFRDRTLLRMLPGRR